MIRERKRICRPTPTRSAEVAFLVWAPMGALYTVGNFLLMRTTNRDSTKTFQSVVCGVRSSLELLCSRLLQPQGSPCLKRLAERGNRRGPGKARAMTREVSRQGHGSPWLCFCSPAISWSLSVVRALTLTLLAGPKWLGETHPTRVLMT
jgi:hypothetical protein